MGSCVSVHKDPESSVNLHISIGSKPDKLEIPSPAKDKINGGGGDHHPTAADDSLGSKEEAFFDSHPWLESDCEDDFFSVNGDFTPSRGSTPVHHSFSTGTPRINTFHYAAKSPNAEPEPSPGDKKKRLSDLFQESLRMDHDNAALNAAKTEAKDAASLGLPPLSANATPDLSESLSVCSSDRTPSVGFKPEEKPVNPMQCCLPRLRSTRSFHERKKKPSLIPSIG